MERRTFMKRTLAGTALGLMGTGGFKALRADALGGDGGDGDGNGGKKIPIAVQVYSVRDAAEKDLAGTLKGLSEMGYKGVEFAGTYGHSAEDVKRMLADAGLVCFSTHIALGDLLGENFDATADYNRTIGNATLIVAGGMGRVLADDGGNQFAAYLFNELALKAKKAGCRVGYHAHAGDFEFVDQPFPRTGAKFRAHTGNRGGIGGQETAWNLFFQRTVSDVIAEMDVGNCLDCGADPYSSMEKAPGRGRVIHLKASKTDGTLLGGEGDEVDWPRVFRICEATAGTEWYIVEQEGGEETDSMNAVAGCLENLRKMGKCS